MSQSDGSEQTPIKAVCGFCGSQQFKYDRCASCGGASLEIVELQAGADTQTHKVLLNQNIKTQNYMNAIGVVLTVSLLVVLYLAFKPDGTTLVTAKVDSHNQKQYMLLEVPTKPIEVLRPEVSLPQMGFSSSMGFGNTSTQNKPSKSTLPTVPESCRFDSIDLSDEFVVYAGRGVGKRLTYQINGRGKAANVVNVTVNQTSVPVVLMLDAVYPTIWNFKRTTGTEIKAIVFNGNNTQVIAGLDDSLPIFANTPQNDYPCGRFKVNRDNAKVLDAVSMALFGVQLEAISHENRSQGGVRFGAPVNYKHQYITDGVSTLSYRDASLPLPGKAGLDQAVRNGSIRPATNADIDKWLKSAKRYGYPSEKLNQIQRMFRHNAYLVVKPFIYPSDLTGGNSVNFFIAKGAPLPTGDPGHSDVFDINSGACLSTICRVLLSER